MRLSKPRVAPVPEAEWTEEQKELLKPLSARSPPINIFKTLVAHPAAMKAFLRFGNHVLSRGNTVPPRERELVILRIGYLCKSGYEFTQHTAIGKRAGLTNEEIERLKSGAGAPGWSDKDLALLKACDDLHGDQFITDATWALLRQHFNDQQCVDLIFTIGQYTQVSMLLNSFGVQLDPGQTLDPDLRK
jgi:4-carboxymuconolactone decarboxylase